jgi:hypothetical protein
MSSRDATWTATTTHPPAMDLVSHPRITLDSVADWERIKDNITRTLLQAIDQKVAEGNLDKATKQEITERTMEVSPHPSWIHRCAQLLLEH